MSAEDQIYDRIKAFLDKNYPCCGVPGCCGEEEEAWAIIDIVKAAGFGLVADAKAEAWDEAHFGALGCDSSCCDYMHGAPETDMNPYRNQP